MKCFASIVTFPQELSRAFIVVAEKALRIPVKGPT
jgi:hypothetical protein